MAIPLILCRFALGSRSVFLVVRGNRVDCTLSRGIHLRAVALFHLTRSVRDFAFRRGWVSIPSPDRHVHIHPLPRLGGVAICFAFLATEAVVTLLAPWFPKWGPSVSVRPATTILIPACVVFLLGVYDDLRGARPWVSSPCKVLLERCCSLVASAFCHYQ